MTENKVLVELTKHSLTYISEEMGIALQRSAYSPNIRERADHSCAVLDQTGRTIGQAEHIPVHIGSLPLGLTNALAYLRSHGVKPAAGEMYFLNDPYIAGTHLNDITVIRPVFVEENLVGYTANKAHHVDVGGIAPASITTNATELNQEGVVLPPTKLVEADIVLQGAAGEFAAKTRMPNLVLGDLRAQVAANLLGDRRLREFVSKIGVDEFQGACSAVLDQTYRSALMAYEMMPHGEFLSEDYLEVGAGLLPIRAHVRMASDGVAVDFEGTAPQVKSPLNAVFGVTTSAVAFAIKTLMPSDLPVNDGFNRTITIKAPLGTILNPVKPAPVAGGNLETSQRIVDVIYRALIAAMPERLPAAAHGSMNNLMMGGILPGGTVAWAFYETIGGGYGGRLGIDGVDGVQVNMTNTMNTPIEVMEHYYPIIFETYGLRSGSGGAGEWRGGVGIERSFTARAEIQVAVLGERNKTRPWGFDGGRPGKASEYAIRRADGKIQHLRSKDSAVLARDETMIIRTAGGGGYGEPDRRDRKRREEDVANGYVTEDGDER